MAISFIAGNADFDGGASSTVSAAALNTAAGDIIAVGIRSGGMVTEVIGVTDTAGNIYRYAGMVLVSNSTSFEVWYCANCAAHAANIVTATFSASNSGRGIAVAQARGLATISPLDVCVRTISSTANPVVSPAFTTALDNEIIFAFAQVNAVGSAWTVGTGYTEACRDSDEVILCQYKIVSSIQTGVTAEATNASGANRVLLVISFHEEIVAGGGGESSMVF